jgi:hypothetical protein
VSGALRAPPEFIHCARQDVFPRAIWLRCAQENHCARVRLLLEPKMIQNAPLDAPERSQNAPEQRQKIARVFVCWARLVVCLVVWLSGWLFVSIWEYLGVSASLEVSGTTWKCLRASGSIYQHLEVYRLSRTCLEHLGYWLMAARYLVPKTLDCSISKLIISGSQKWGRNMDALFDRLQRASTVEFSDEHVTP